MVISWNVKHLGRKNEDLDATADLLKMADIVAFQEVNTKPTGQEGLKKIALHLKDKLKVTICEGLSAVPSGAKERYAFLWRDDRVAYVKVDGEVMPHCPPSALTIPVSTKHTGDIVREPALGHFQFRVGEKKFTLASIHLLPSGKGPQHEVPPLFDIFTDVEGPLIIAGDFNLDARNPVFEKPLTEMKFKAAITDGEKTSLRMNKAERSKAYDNFFFRDFLLEFHKVIDLHDEFGGREPRDIYDNISDHCPIRGEFSFPEETGK